MNNAARSSSRCVGEAAPDIDVPTTERAKRLHEFRGKPIILVFHSPHWDPARADEIASYGVPADTITVLLHNDDPAAEQFGVTGESAVFVVDAFGVIAWRHVTGVDRVSQLTAYANVDVGAERNTQHDTQHSEQHDQWTRRSFVAMAIGVAIALAIDPALGHARAAAEPFIQSTRGDPVPVVLTVNGKTISLTLEPRVTLLDALREYAGLTGTKKGCDHGQCGACTIHIDGRRTLSCLTFAVMQQGKAITTIEGLAAGDALTPMQQAFIDHDGFQCGYCTSGQIMSATAVVSEPWGPGDDDIREAMSGNICRCGAYPGIVAAVQDVRHNGGGQMR